MDLKRNLHSKFQINRSNVMKRWIKTLERSITRYAKVQDVYLFFVGVNTIKMCLELYCARG